MGAMQPSTAELTYQLLPPDKASSAAQSTYLITLRSWQQKRKPNRAAELCLGGTQAASQPEAWASHAIVQFEGEAPPTACRHYCSPETRQVPGMPA